MEYGQNSFGVGECANIGHVKKMNKKKKKEKKRR